MAKLLMVIVFLSLFVLISNINMAIAQERIQNETKVTINKEVYGDPLHPELIYKIITPKLIDFNFVLAVDSSGSFGVAGNELECEAVREDIPNFIKKIPSLYPNENFNISIISWDNDIDFAYEDFNNNDPKKARLVPIDKAINDSDNFKNEFSCLETDGTNISKALEASFDVLGSDQNRPNNLHKTKEFIILLTGKGEFTPATPTLIKKVQSKYEIYTIGMDIASQPSLRSHLIELAINNDKRWKFIGAGSPELESTLNRSLELALEEILGNARNSSVAHDVKIVETLYSYFRPDSASFRINGRSLDPQFVNIAQNKEDKTWTVTIELPDGLLPNSETEVAFNANFEPGNLPVSLTKNRKPVIICSPSKVPPSAQFDFNWFNGDHFGLELPEGEHYIGKLRTKSISLQSNGKKDDLYTNMLKLFNWVV